MRFLFWYDDNMQFPKLANLSDLASKYSGIDFSRTVLIGVQHLLATNGSLLEQLNTLGIPYERMFLLGKVYSTNDKVYEELTRRGVRCHPFSIESRGISMLQDYNLALRHAAEELLQEALHTLDAYEGADKILIVVDDGGVLASTVSNHAHEINARIVGVEQTRSGAEAIRAIPSLSFPIINVAESRKKLIDESPYIARSIIDHTIKRVKRLPVSPLRKSNALVVGYGAVGSQVAEQLKKYVRSVQLHDTNKDLPVDVIADLQSELSRFDIIIGCVGKTWLPVNYHSLLRGDVVLVSGSSSNTEFLGITTLHESINDVHADYCFATSNGLGWLLNAGFPVNFDGSPDPIPSKTIELTRMLMLNGIAQAVTTTARSGLLSLSVAFDR